MATSRPDLSKKPSVRKRSVKIGGHATSVSVEDGFWDTLIMIAAKRRVTIASLIEEVDRDRQSTNLSSAIRLFILREVRSRDFQGAPQKRPRGPAPKSRRAV